MILVPKNWSEFQHYKDRMPPWIKLHKSLLDDRVFMTLPVDSKALAPLLWLLASENMDGKFNASIEELSFRLRMKPEDVEKGLNPLLQEGFFLDASTMLAPCLQVAVPETETETETETEEKPIKKNSKKTKKEVIRPDLVSEQVWEDFLTHRKAKKAPLTQTALDGFIREADKAGYTLEQAIKKSIEKNWRGFEADWVKEKINNENSRYGELK